MVTSKLVNRGFYCPTCRSLGFIASNDVAKKYLLDEWSTNNKDSAFKTSLNGIKKQLWVCPKCGNEYYMTPHKRNLGRNCHYCSSTKLYIGNCLKTIYPFQADMFDRAKNIDSDGRLITSFDIFPTSIRKVNFMCPECGTIFCSDLANVVRNNQTCCPTCASGKNERRIGSYLEQHSVLEIKKQYTPVFFKKYPHSRRQRIDFAIPELKIGIEYNGRQHYGPVDFAGKGSKWAAEEFKITQKRDDRKKRLCEKNVWKLVEIPHFLEENAQYTLIDNLLKEHNIYKTPKES
jgi:rubrerythrin